MFLSQHSVSRPNDSKTREEIYGSLKRGESCGTVPFEESFKRPAHFLYLFT